jgi:hypothetical protein
MQREWLRVSRSVTFLGEFKPSELPPTVSVDTELPFVVLYIAPHQRVLPSPRDVESSPLTARFARWHGEQVEDLRRMYADLPEA